MLVEDIKKRVAQAVKQGDTVTRDVLRLALGEIQMLEVRKNAPIDEEEMRAALRKLIKSNEETLAALAPSDERVAGLRQELTALQAFLPSVLSVDGIVDVLNAHKAALCAPTNDGQATGIAMKLLAAAGATVKGADVGIAVKRIRSTG
jgi:uncharacterized protein YqeY